MTSLLRNSCDVTIFCYCCLEYIKLDTCAKFHDHPRNNSNKVIMAPHSPLPPPPPMTDDSKKPMSNRVKIYDVTKLKETQIIS